MAVQNRVSAPDIGNSSARQVRLDGVWKEYHKFVAVEDVSFALKPGEFLTLLGPSGSGKTSTLMMVAGFEMPTRGAITVDGVDVVSRSPKDRNFGVVFQGYALFPHMTARENVEFPLRMRHQPAELRRKLALEMLEKVGLSAFADRRPRELSGGQQQRVALARALVFSPDALLLDEPLGALDKNMRERMQDEIKELQARIGISILFVTHDQNEAMSMSDRIAVMNAGRIVQIGSPQDIYYRPSSPFVASFFGETNLISCEIGEMAGSLTQVSFAGGASGPAANSLGVRLPKGRGLVSVRPERVRLLAGDDRADIEFRATVKECTFLGRYFRVILATDHQRFAVVTSDPNIAGDLVAGQSVRIGWMAAEGQLLLPEETARGT